MSDDFTCLSNRSTRYRFVLISQAVMGTAIRDIGDVLHSHIFYVLAPISNDVEIMVRQGIMSDRHNA